MPYHFLSFVEVERLLSGQRKQCVSSSFDFCAHATVWFWFRLLRVHLTVLCCKFPLLLASSSSNSNCKQSFLMLSEHLPQTEKRCPILLFFFFADRHFFSYMNMGDWKDRMQLLGHGTISSTTQPTIAQRCNNSCYRVLTCSVDLN